MDTLQAVFDAFTEEELKQGYIVKKQPKAVA